MLPRLLEPLGSMRMKRQETEIEKGEVTSCLLSRDPCSEWHCFEVTLTRGGCLALQGVPAERLAFLP